MKTAIVGLGHMGRRHLQIVRALELELAGAADCLEKSRTGAREESGLGDDILFADGLEMITEIKLELLIVSTTAPSHAELVCRAADSGVKAILCEKPMAVSLEQCDRMIEACEKGGAKLAINHQMRFMDQYLLPKKMAGSPEHGGLSSINVVTGNFGIAMNGAHYFEMFRFMTDETPSTVQAWFDKDKIANPRGPEFEDRSGCVRLTTPSGKRFHMDCSANQGHGLHVSYATHNGRIDVDELAGRMTSSVRKTEHRDEPTTRYGTPWDEDSQTIAPADAVAPSRAVLESLLGNGDYPDGQIGRMAVEILVAAHQSNDEDGRVVELARTPLPRDRIFSWA